ncbi:iron-sulfur cluster co-chaperone protein HscB homolog isoform X2 [Elaeis guineensis]|uniref:Iron-sulfur cluster co-chaperone protein HscB homolog isoform X2 n=1 Tax=Elaeis guineensis var. tenera TaxID=51953 RepID=A0A6I9SC51_ELAGV|nr:iron-sulfur cluster co-chaperone protein HscB homolog isoform X2 [Elaeis guineensis]
MSSWRKLWVSGLSLLCRRYHLPPDLHLGLRSARVLMCSLPRPFTSCSGHHRPFPESRVFGRFCFSSESSNGRCWNCGAAAALAEPFLSCRACGSVQPVDQSVDYFQIFGLEKGYDIQDDNLEGKYKDWQKKLHPDLVHLKSEKEKTFAANQSARVNDAYRTISKSLSRAVYLMRLEGVHVDEEKTVMDLDLLSEMMEIREAVEEASDSHALRQLQSQVYQIDKKKI